MKDLKNCESIVIDSTQIFEDAEDCCICIVDGNYINETTATDELFIGMLN